MPKSKPKRIVKAAQNDSGLSAEQQQQFDKRAAGSQLETSLPHEAILSYLKMIEYGERESVKTNLAKVGLDKVMEEETKYLKIGAEIYNENPQLRLTLGMSGMAAVAVLATRAKAFAAEEEARAVFHEKIQEKLKEKAKENGKAFSSLAARM